MLFVSDLAEERALRLLLRGPLEICLYTNSWSPLPSDNDFTFKQIGTPNRLYAWDVSTGVAKHPDVSWTFTTSMGDVHGYFVRDYEGLRWAEQFPDPFTIETSGDTIKITPRFQIRRA